jgi:UDP-N-acetylmuramoylalanine--D-glutamate ligase
MNEVLEEVAVAARGREYLATLAGRRVTVVGLAKSGIAAARLLAAAGADVRATDAKPFATLGRDVAALAGAGVSLVDGPDAYDGATLVVVSPGVPVDGEQLAPVRARGVPIVGELELGWRALEADTIAITGTNGKTTTTALTGALLAEQPRPVFVGGNIGTPLASRALSFPAAGLVVAEVSSFQLETIEVFQPRVAAVLNVTPDHLDRHGSFARYLEAKARIFMNQTPADCAVLNADDEPTRGLVSRTRAHVLWFSRQRALDHGVFVRDGWIVAKLNGHTDAICPLDEIHLRGQHNVENVLAATACALWTGVSIDAIRRGIGRFRAVAHRIEFVRDVGGVQFYNDSKGTNVASTIKALQSFDERIVLIAGGKGKGQDFAPLAEAARGRVVHAVVIGEDGGRVAGAFADAGIGVTAAETLASAIAAARAAAGPGDVVLLSPACASFDMFDNYEHRGDVFKQLIVGLEAVGGPGGGGSRGGRNRLQAIERAFPFGELE